MTEGDIASDGATSDDVLRHMKPTSDIICRSPERAGEAHGAARRAPHVWRGRLVLITPLPVPVPLPLPPSWSLPFPWHRHLLLLLLRIDATTTITTTTPFQLPAHNCLVLHCYAYHYHYHCYRSNSCSCATAVAAVAAPHRDCSYSCPLRSPFCCSRLVTCSTRPRAASGESSSRHSPPGTLRHAGRDGRTRYTDAMRHNIILLCHVASAHDV